MLPPQRHPDDGFYAALPAFDRFEDIAEAGVYARVPDSWHILVTDVRGSTQAIEAGRYKDVNALGVSTITAVVNCIPDLAFPYVFGGDGATILVPPGRLDNAVLAARNALALARDAFGLELRAGIVPVSTARARGNDVRVARYRVSRHVTLAMFEGGGLAVAESLVKDPEHGVAFALAPVDAADPAVFEGFECRWRPIQSRKHRVLSLLVAATSETPDLQRQVYRRVLAGIAAAAHLGIDGMHPVDVGGLSLSSAAADLRVEAAVRSGRAAGLRHWWRRVRTAWMTRVGRLLFRRRIRVKDFDGATYRDDLVANTDFRKFDGMLRMVLDVSEAELREIERFLETERAADAIVYGLHASGAALITCFIRDYAGDHVHFVDGSDGGYALAARELKRRWKERAAD